MEFRDARLVFLGTPPFAVPSLEALAAAGAKLVAVITEPPKPAGRGRALRKTAVAARAQSLGLPLFPLAGFRNEEHRRVLAGLRPDLLVVVAYGHILPKAVLKLPRFGAVNVHASLLPKYRGPAPISAALLAGDATTGVTIIKLDEGIDTGPILAREELPISPETTTRALSVALAERGASLLVRTLARYLAGALSPTPQDERAASRCRLLRKEDGRLDWRQPAVKLARMVRAYDPWPGTFTTWEGQPLLVRAASALRGERSEPTGTVCHLPEGIAVATGEGLLLLRTVQLSGGKTISAADFARGHPTFLGSRLS